MTAAATIEKPKGTRKHKPAQYILQAISDDGNWFDAVIGLQDAAEAKKNVRDNESVGKFRLVRIVDEFTAVAETVTKIKLS